MLVIIHPSSRRGACNLDSKLFLCLRKPCTDTDQYQNLPMIVVRQQYTAACLLILVHRKQCICVVSFSPHFPEVFREFDRILAVLFTFLHESF